MTNLEWIKKNINEMGAEAFIDYCFDHKLNPWCSVCDDDIADATDCRRCVARWLEAKHQDPMPQLKVGMFIEWDGHLLGVVVNNFIVFQDGTYASDMNEASKHITKVFANIVCFNECSMMKPMWRRD